MDWLQVLTIVASTIGCCLYFRRETKVQLDKMERYERERDQEVQAFKERCAANDREDHGRMCALEERYIQMMKGQEEIRTLMLQKALERK